MELNVEELRERIAVSSVLLDACVGEDLWCTYTALKR